MDKTLLGLKELCSLNRNGVFGHHLDVFSNHLGEIDRSPFIGYVGQRFFTSTNKICFLGKFGAASTAQSEAGDRAMHAAFLEFKNATEADAESAFREYCDVVRTQLPAWGTPTVPTALNELLSEPAEEILDEMAFANFIPYRMASAPDEVPKEVAPTAEIYRIAANRFVKAFLEAVRPKFVVPLGSGLGKKIDRSNRPITSYVFPGVPMHRKSTVLHADAPAVLRDEIADRINKGLQRRSD